MPELPEVETTRLGIAPHILGQSVSQLIIRQPALRWSVLESLPQLLAGQRIDSVARRGKYLLLGAQSGTVILHLGMSGSLRIVLPGTAHQKHDHADFIFANGRILRFHDPRRFGAILWTADDPSEHPLLKLLGPEPLHEDFSGDYLYEMAQECKTAIKTFIMDSRIVVGIGNIYANEVLFEAGIHPKRICGRVSRYRYRALADSIRSVLSAAIALGGTTLRDFVNEKGSPGYFQQTLKVYGRKAQPCPRCGTPIRQTRLGQRATYYCPNCQH